MSFTAAAAFSAILEIMVIVPLLLPELERIPFDLALHGDPLGFGECLDVGVGAAEARPGSGCPDPAEGNNRLVVDRLVVDVHDSAVHAVGERERAQRVLGE